MKTTGAIRARYRHQNKYSLLSRTETAANFIITRLSIGYANNHIFHSETTFTFDKITIKLKHMSAKFSQTTADFLEWSQAMNLIRKLHDDKKYTLSLYVACSCFFGLRASDTLSLRWEDLLGKDEFQLTEKKTQKRRDIKINQQLKKHISDCYNKIKPASLNDFMFLSQKNTVFSLQRINIILKDLKKQYSLKVRNFSSHSLRKSFGREVFNRSAENAELAIVKLSQLFNHSNPSITRRYLGISQKELLDTYDILSF